MSEQENNSSSESIVAFVSADNETEEVRMIFNPEFYRWPIKEQTSIIKSILSLAVDELDGIAETEIDRLESEIEALKTATEIAA